MKGVLSFIEVLYQDSRIILREETPGMTGGGMGELHAVSWRVSKNLSLLLGREFGCF